MKNLHKLFILTITVLCAGYSSTFAQDEQKAFEEGDKVISLGFNRGGTLSGNTNYAPTVNFDYGLKGTRGIVSLGGFFSYSHTPYANNHSGFSGNSNDTYILTKGIGNTNTNTYTLGLRAGLHFATRKWDLYGGGVLGFQKTTWESGITQMDYYEKSNLTRTEYENSKTYSDDGRLIFSPYIGVRYLFTKKIGLYLEAHPTTLSTGLSYKF